MSLLGSQSLQSILVHSNQVIKPVFPMRVQILHVVIFSLLRMLEFIWRSRFEISKVVLEI